MRKFLYTLSAVALLATAPLSAADRDVAAIHKRAIVMMLTPMCRMIWALATMMLPSTVNRILTFPNWNAAKLMRRRWRRYGYSDADINKIWGGNYLRVFHAVEAVSHSLSAKSAKEK